MTPRILPGSLVSYGAHRCSVLSIVRRGDDLRANLDCQGARIPDVPAELLTLVAPPPAIPHHQLKGLYA